LHAVSSNPREYKQGGTKVGACTCNLGCDFRSIFARPQTW
jgi:hypothetical protein